MDFSSKCLDCPLLLSEVLLLFGLLLIGIVIGAAMQESRYQFFRGLGFLLTALVLFWAVAFTSVIPRWGISRFGDDPLGEWPRRMSWLLLGGLDLLLVAIVYLAHRRRLARARV
jgi:hypothetical protein